MIKAFIARLRNKKNTNRETSSRTAGYFILTDMATNAVLVISQYAGPVIFLHRTIPDTGLVLWASRPHYQDNFPLAGVKPSDFPNWTYTRDRKILPTRSDVLTDRVKTLSKLAVAKEQVISEMIYNLNTGRLRRSGLVLLQEHIYLKKHLEAERFRASGYDESDMLAYPYLLQYADFANLPFRDAAEEILLKAKMHDDELAKTEFLRLKYFNKVKEAQTPEELPPIQEEFRRELYINAIV